MAGALFSFVFREKGILETKLSSIGFGFFVPLFFIWVGTEFDLSRRVERWRLLARWVCSSCVSLAAKLLPCCCCCWRGFSLREALGAGLLLGAPLTLLVAISRIGLDVKVIDKTTASAVVLLAIATGVVLPWTFRLLMRRSATADPH